MRMGVVLLAALAVLAVAAPYATGQTRDPGDLGVFFDAEATVTAIDGVVAFESFDVYVVSFDVPGGMEAYEFQLLPQFPSGLVVSGGRVLPPGATDFGQGEDNWIVGTGGLCHGQNGLFVLVAYHGILFLSNPGVGWPFCLAGAEPTSFPNGGGPGYLVCSSPGVLRNFGFAYRGCAEVNPCPLCGAIPDAVSSFGGLKARF